MSEHKLPRVSIQLHVTVGASLPDVLDAAIEFANTSKIGVWFDWNGEFRMIIVPGDKTKEYYLNEVSMLLAGKKLESMAIMGNA